jgi:hypothetical protein
MSINRQVYIDVDFDIRCDGCGESLEWNEHRKTESIFVIPCEFCLNETKEENK